MFATKRDFYIENATVHGTGNDKFESTTLQKYRVPSDKRWYLTG
ncbi:unnamed protein product, partial [marine sediment metagenome]